jgi:hypothetical protein
MVERMKKMPLLVKVLIAGIPILIVIIWFMQLQINGRDAEKDFFLREISSVVVKSNSYYGRSEEFHLEDGVKLYFMPPIDDKIIIGDSVRKEPNTYVYYVYRKDENGEYNFWNMYNRKRMY